MVVASISGDIVNKILKLTKSVTRARYRGNRRMRARSTKCNRMTLTVLLAYLVVNLYFVWSGIV